VVIAEPSVQSLFLIAMGNGQELGTGTGFVVQHNDQPYLITNYHLAGGSQPPQRAIATFKRCGP